LNRPTQHAETSSVEHAAFKLDGVHCLGCATAVEEALRAQPSVTDVRLDWKADVVRVGYDPTKIGREDIERVIADTGCECEPVEAGGELPKHLPPQKRRWQHLGHGVHAQPVTMRTKHDRMQYEMPATQVDHDAHADMGHDMSDPGMAGAMERDMRNKFFVALLLTIPTVLYSPLGMSLLGLRLPDFGLGENVIMLVLSTPVVFYSGWIFISGSYYSLRRRLPLQRPDHVHRWRNLL
jgi:P-type Cu2+ transporter